jgi:hypothetical protein
MTDPKALGISLRAIIGGEVCQPLPILKPRSLTVPALRIGCGAQYRRQLIEQHRALAVRGKKRLFSG